MTSPTKIPDFVKVMEKLKSECHGPCLGIGIGVDIRWGPCPEPCDQEILDSVVLSAKTKANENAQEACRSHGKHCSCAGVLNEVFKPQCVAVEGGWCVYLAAYWYAGECAHWF